MKLVSNFVMTVDGKVQGPGAGYWPIGSPADLAQLLELRAAADAVIHGRMTALGHQHIARLRSAEFRDMLERHGQKGPYTYVVVSAHPDDLLIKHIDPAGANLRVVLATTEAAEVPDDRPKAIEVWRLGTEQVDLPGLRERMAGEGWQTAALEAGPKLFGAFVAAGLVDDLYVTVAPKLFGTSFGTPTMINGVLFEPDRLPQLKLVSHKAVGDEIFVHYTFGGRA